MHIACQLSPHENLTIFQNAAGLNQPHLTFLIIPSGVHFLNA